MAEHAKIQPIEKGTVHRICSGQVILDLATAVKELVENALDAGATNIEVRVKEYGVELIEVADNGCGIAPADYRALTLKYHTSKLQDFSDLQSLQTFGFRGEALSSLCSMSELSVTTRQSDQAAATKLEFDSRGELKSTTTAPRSAGTTVSLKNLFGQLPVRLKEFKRNAKKEFAKLLTMLQAYAVICTGVRIICTHQGSGSSRSTVVSTQGAQSVRDNIVTVFGAKVVQGLEALDALAGSSTRIKGFISKGIAGVSRASGDRQFTYLNGRPVDMPNVTKLVNEAFRTLCSSTAASQKPMFIIDIQAPTDSYDVNVTPDKRKVFLQDERELMSALQEAVNELWEPTRSRYQVGGVPSQKKVPHRHGKEIAEDSAGEGETDSGGEADDSPQPSRPVMQTFREGLQAHGAQRSERLPSQTTSGQGTRFKMLTGSSNTGSKGSSQPLMSRFVMKTAVGPKPSCNDKAPTSVHSTERSSSSEEEESAEALSNGGDDMEVDGRDEAFSPGEEPAAEVPADNDPVAEESLNPHRTDEHASEETASAMSDPGEGLQQTPSRSTPECKAAAAAEDEEHGRGAVAKRIRLVENSDLTAIDLETQPDDAAALALERKRGWQQCSASFDAQSFEKRWARAKAKLAAPQAEQVPHRQATPFQAASLQGGDEQGENDISTATAEFERVFDKALFCKLSVLGQFNLGFILTRLGRDLFIVDQHASDEKYNFELLTRTTQLSLQPLVVPQPLDLTPSEAVTVREHLHVFAQNGFEIKTSSSGNLLLAGVPLSKKTTFGKADVQELAQLLSESVPVQQQGQPSGTQSVSVGVHSKLLRPSRVRAMLAMRACRSSIMIGKPLDRPTMRRVIDNLAGLESPWNCPHGRPTMRHLAILPAQAK